MFRTVTITAVLNGYIVNVGCQTVTFNSKEEMAVALLAYCGDPTTTERKWLTQSVNARLMSPHTGAEHGGTPTPYDQDLHYIRHRENQRLQNCAEAGSSLETKPATGRL